ncbi:MAG: DUF1669 domain-containing protein [Verrucomicrobia bacterium]|nr:DUF1669 domain-containing protein [Verrucomicrobiota bacterium]
MRICKLLLILFFSSPVLAAVAGSYATVYFSPEDHVEQRLISLIEKEKRSIHVAVYSLTHRRIANALIEAKQRGVEVTVIVDRFSVKAKSPLLLMSQAGIPIYVWDSDPQKTKKSHRALMHHKFCVFGDDFVWTGSFNWTYEASRSHKEDVIVIRDPTLASAYKDEFYHVQSTSCVSLASYVAYNKK